MSTGAQYSVVVSNSPQQSSRLLCRTCLKIGSKSYMYNIFDGWPLRWKNMSSNIADDLARVANIEVLRIDPYSEGMCTDCCRRLYDASNFISMVKDSDEFFKQKCSQQEPEESPSSSNKIWPKPIQVDKFNPMQVEVKEELLSDECDTPNGTEEGYRDDLDLEIKVEPEEFLQPMPIQITVNGTISLSQMESQTPLTNGGEVYENEENTEIGNTSSQQYLDGTVKEEPMSEDDEHLPSDLPLECMLCTKTFHSISGLKAHVIAQHSYKSVKRKPDNNASPEQNTATKKHICATCYRCFVTSTDLMVHETCHNKSTCYSCCEKFDSFALLTKHRRKCKGITNAENQKPKTLEDVIRLPRDMVIEAVKRTKTKESTSLQCSLCPEKFTDQYYMKIHHEIHHLCEQNPDAEQKKIEQKNEGDPRNNTNTDDAMETESLQSMFEARDTDKCKQREIVQKYTEAHENTNKEDNTGNLNNTEKQEKIVKQEDIEKQDNTVKQDNPDTEQNYECSQGSNTDDLMDIDMLQSVIEEICTGKSEQTKSVLINTETHENKNKEENTVELDSTGYHMKTEKQEDSEKQDNMVKQNTISKQDHTDEQENTDQQDNIDKQVKTYNQENSEKQENSENPNNTEKWSNKESNENEQEKKTTETQENAEQQRDICIDVPLVTDISEHLRVHVKKVRETGLNRENENNEQMPITEPYDNKQESNSENDDNKEEQSDNPETSPDNVQEHNKQDNSEEVEKNENDTAVIESVLESEKIET